MNIKKKIYIKNMLCFSSIKLLKYEFENNNIKVDSINIGSATISYEDKEVDMKKISSILESNGMSIIISREQKIVEKIKQAVIELIHYMNNVDSIVRKSDYLVEKLGLSYQQLSKIFSKNETITLEKYIILNKIERIKHLIDTKDFTLSEIAYMMDYSSVQYLSNQFKKITGFSVSDYKQYSYIEKIPIDKLMF